MTQKLPNEKLYWTRYNCAFSYNGNTTVFAFMFPEADAMRVAFYGLDFDTLHLLLHDACSIYATLKGLPFDENNFSFAFKPLC